MLTSPSAGTPLSLAQLVQSPLLHHRSAIPESSTTEVQSILLSPDKPDAAPFPLLGQGEHPTLGTPSWYLHPCETSAAIKELLDDIIGDQWDEEDPQRGLVRWLSTWFMVVGSIIHIHSLP